MALEIQNSIQALNEAICAEINKVAATPKDTVWILYSDGTVTYQGQWTYGVAYKYLLPFDHARAQQANASFKFPTSISNLPQLSACTLVSKRKCEEYRHQMEQLLFLLP